jgi:hypothetical protein
MRRWNSILMAFCLAGVVVAPAAAVDVGEYLSITGFIDNQMRYVDNLSSQEEAGRGDLTLDNDEQWSARTRGRIFFNVQPNVFSKAVFGIELDQTWGDDTGDGTGFDLGNDNNVFELKHLYVDIKIPSTPLQVQIGGFAVDATTLKRCVIFCDDAGGIAVQANWSPNFSTYTWFIIAEEELIEEGPDTLGEDFSAGTTFMFKLAKGMEIHLLGAYYDIDGPSSDSSSLMVGSCSASREGSSNGVSCFARDQRYYFGVDSQFKFGGFTLSPTFLYLGGTRDIVGGGEADLQAFLLDVRGEYSWGPLSIEGRFVYIPGNEADDDLGDGSNLHFWQNISVTTVHRSVQWFELMGWNFDTTSAEIFGGNNSRAMQSAGTFDQFGLIHPSVKVDYQVAKPLTLTAAVGAFLTDEDTGAPARFGGDVPNTYNWTGNDNYLGTEFDVWLSYDWFKGTTIDVWFAYAAIGDGQDLCAPGTGGTTGVACNVLEAEDQIGFGARMLYRF